MNNLLRGKATKTDVLHSCILPNTEQKGAVLSQDAENRRRA